MKASAYATNAAAQNAQSMEGILQTMNTSGDLKKVTRLQDGESSSLQTKDMVTGTINKAQPAQTTGHVLQCRKNGN